jgi:hypothetical protein
VRPNGPSRPLNSRTVSPVGMAPGADNSRVGRQFKQIYYHISNKLQSDAEVFERLSHETFVFP